MRSKNFLSKIFTHENLTKEKRSFDTEIFLDKKLSSQMREKKRKSFFLLWEIKLDFHTHGDENRKICILCIFPIKRRLINRKFRQKIFILSICTKLNRNYVKIVRFVLTKLSAWGKDLPCLYWCKKLLSRNIYEEPLYIYSLWFLND
jgi:hypothetical protein